MVMGTVYWTLMIGFLVGALAKFIFQRMKQGEIFATMTAGLIGSVIGGWLGSRLGIYEYGTTDGLVASLIGAVIAVCLYCLYYRKRSHRLH